MNIASLKTPGELVTEMIMTRMGFSGSFLVVEGDDDSRFFGGRIARDTCEIVIAGGKPALEACFVKLEAQRFPGVLGVCDDDCSSLDGNHAPSPHIITTEARDLDAWLVRSPALDRVLAEYGDPKAIQAFERANGAIRENLVRLAQPFGQLRWVSSRDVEGISFDNLQPFRFVDSKWAFDPNALFDEAEKLAKAEPSSLRARVAALPNVDPWLVCQGHDLLAILAQGLSKRGILGTRNPGAKTIASTLRASLDTNDWNASRMVGDIRRWESNNTPYRVLNAATSLPSSS